jgi:hypothetical protein
MNEIARIGWRHTINLCVTADDRRPAGMVPAVPDREHELVMNDWLMTSCESTRSTTDHGTLFVFLRTDLFGRLPGHMIPMPAGRHEPDRAARHDTSFSEPI